MNKYRLSIYMGEKNQMKRSEINGNGKNTGDWNKLFDYSRRYTQDLIVN